jgi:hypothetical protein
LLTVILRMVVLGTFGVGTALAYTSSTTAESSTHPSPP